MIGVASALAVGASASVASAATWVEGDVFAGFSDTTYDVYSNSGTLKENVSTGQAGFGTGCTFNDEEDFYATTFSAGQIVVLDGDHPHGILQTINAAAQGKSNPESIVFARNGDFFVGGPFTGGILRFDANGNFEQAFDAESAGVGTDWVDLAADQRTIFYTGEGQVVKRYDVASDTQLSDFASLPAGGQAFALRLLPPGTGSGGLLVAYRNDIVRLNGSGDVVQTYDAPGEDFWFALNIDPNGRSFWSAGLSTGNLYRFNIQTGAVEVGPIATGRSVGGLCVKGEPTAARPDEPGEGTCAGQPATIVGTSGRDTLTGTDGPDVITGRGGNDVIEGVGDDDRLCGNSGNDRVDGGSGDDFVRGNPDEDRVNGGPGDDDARGGRGDDRVDGDGGDDRLRGNPGDDHLVGGEGRDRCNGDSGNDTEQGCEVTGRFFP
jgi:Ca2+-binding RTX toxin-like protein